MKGRTEMENVADVTAGTPKARGAAAKRGGRGASRPGKKAMRPIARAMRLMASAASREEGEGFVDVLVKMLIVVVVGAALLAIMRTAVPQLFSDMVAKVRGIFEL